MTTVFIFSYQYFFVWSIALKLSHGPVELRRNLKVNPFIESCNGPSPGQGKVYFYINATCAMVILLGV